MRLLAADSDEAGTYGVAQRLTVNARAAGPRLGKDVQKAIKGSKSGDWSVAEDGAVTPAAWRSWRVSTPSRPSPARPRHRRHRHAAGGGFVVLDTAVTPELAAEGLASDLVRAVQQARRDAGLDVSDRIALTVGGSDACTRRPAPRGADRLGRPSRRRTPWTPASGSGRGHARRRREATVLVAKA